MSDTAPSDAAPTASGAMTVRNARTGDLPFLVDCNLAMARETEARLLDRAVLMDGVATVLAQPGRGFYLVAECSGAAAGCVLVTHEWSDWRNGQWWWLQSVYVVPAARRRGVFRALHAEVLRRAAAAPDVIGMRLYVERENHAAQKTYASLGMHETVYCMFEAALGPGNEGCE